MNSDWTSWLARWSDAGLIDPATAERIRAFEQERVGQTRLRWPILVALAFGAVMLAGGILLFVAAHWDGLSPGQRFAIVLLMVAVLHSVAAASADRFPAMAATLHGVGTVSLGAGIALGGQIFHLDEHWPGGVMLWALGAGLAWALLGHACQLALFALLAPAWLASEWIVATGEHRGPAAMRVLAVGIFLLVLAYFTAPGRGRASVQRRALMWVGGVALIPAAIALALAAPETDWLGGIALYYGEQLSVWISVAGWTVAVGGPLVLGFLLHRMSAWPLAVAVVWVMAMLAAHPRPNDAALYAFWAAGAIGLVAWGVSDGRTERINVGAALFSITIVGFYFSHVMDKLGRSASLVGLGLLFLGGGWALERVRRRLIGEARGTV